MFTNLYITLTSYLFAARLANRRLVGARGANFVEYALLAVIAVVLFALFNDTLSSTFSRVYVRIREALSTGDTGGTTP